MGVQEFYLEQITGNYWGILDLIQKSADLENIQSLSKNQKFIQQPTKDTPYFNRWNIVWVTLTQPFYLILSVFCSTVSVVSYCLYLPKCGRVFTVLSRQLTRDWEELCVQGEFSSPLLIPSFNVHQFSTWDIYGQGDVPYASIRDKKVKSLTFQNHLMEKGARLGMKMFYAALEEARCKQSWTAWIYNRGTTVSTTEKATITEKFLQEYQTSLDHAMAFLRKKYSRDSVERPIQFLYEEIKNSEKLVDSFPHVSLFSDKGLCRGASLWFIFLYHKAKLLFDNETKHLMAVAKQFTSGIPRQATLLQALDDSDDLLHLRKTEMRDHAISLYELDTNAESAKEKIASLPPGIYKVGAYCHSFVYVKNNEEEQFMWNPDFGLYPMKSEEMLEMIRKHHYKEGDPGSAIYFYRYEPAESA